MKESSREADGVQNSERQAVKAGSEVYRKEKTFKDPSTQMLMLLSGRPGGGS